MEAALNSEGFYVAIEGPDCSGKGTQARLLISKLGSTLPDRRLIVVREPGGTDVGERIRDVVLSSKNYRMTDRCELLLFCAGRAQLMEELIEPALERGFIVFSERYFLSSLVYQGIALGLGMEAVQAICDFAVNSRWPNKTFVLDIPVQEIKSRLERRGRGDRIESRPVAFHQKVRDGYLLVAAQHPETIEVVDGTEPVENIHQRIWLSTLNKMLETDRISGEQFLNLRK